MKDLFVSTEINHYNLMSGAHFASFRNAIVSLFEIETALNLRVNVWMTVSEKLFYLIFFLFKSFS